MYILKQDLAYLEVHAGLKEDKSDPYQPMHWFCLYTKVKIEFIEEELFIDDGEKVSQQTIMRPFCPQCQPNTCKKPHQYLSSVAEPVAKKNIVESLL